MHKHPHWKLIVIPVLVLFVVVALGSFLGALVATQSWAPWAWLGLVVVGAALILWLTVIPVIRWRTTHFVITSRRVLVREGVLSRHGIDIPMSRIDTVQFRHTLVERLLGCGTLIIESSSDEPLEFDDVPGVQRVHAMLCAAVADEG